MGKNHRLKGPSCGSRGFEPHIRHPGLESGTGETSPLSWFENPVELTWGLYKSEAPLLKSMHREVPTMVQWAKNSTAAAQVALEAWVN